mmetsp:Transcript_19821/g.48700  ORF Transcript_19821/g.48700 Transcript_19821/m.48700 type:complete len:280 (+) Transcript_19821:303-1142(+)
MNSTPFAMNIWKPRVRESTTELPEDFVPQPYTVHIGRGKVCSETTGNRRLKVIVDSFLQEYRKATTKIEKSVIVSKIVDIIHDACPTGAFVKFQGGKWWEVGDYAAREKVGSMLRDSLSEKYRSSSKAKLARRKQAKQAVYEAAKSNVINEILNIKHDEEEHDTAAEDSTDDKAKESEEKQESSSPKKQSPKSTPGSSLTSSLSTKKNFPTPTEAPVLRLQRDLKHDKALQQISSSAATTSTTTPSFRSLHSNCAPIANPSFYDINYGSAAVGLQWYSL